jgi:uncharacterized protein YcbK (DUF882 family)
MANKRYPKNSHELLTPHFFAFEFDCPCDRPDCDFTLIDEDLPPKVELMREFVGCALRITSGYRCDGHQEDLKEEGFETAKKSEHPKGRAVDLWTGKHSGDELAAAARKAGFKAVGIGGTFVHADLRPEFHEWRYVRRLA